MKKNLLLLICSTLLALLTLSAQNKYTLGSVDSLPSAIIFLSTPPQPGSIDFARDSVHYVKNRSLKGAERWSQAYEDAAILNDADNWVNLYEKEIGITISKEKTPALYSLLIQSEPYWKAAYNPAKKHFARVRPFIYFNEPAGSTCDPADEPNLGNYLSYPSGHTAYGWSIALILSEVFPEKQSELFKRAFDYGYSRVICGVHWLSDVEAGTTVATATIIYLNTRPAFVNLLNKARAEVKNLR
ncbi:acid phosphatase [Bacteroidia bacterium]|nr:acid phosphatase [Bacteroidia bacterium]